MKINKTFPYNENQRRLHLSEDKYLENIEDAVKYFAKTPKEKVELRKRLFTRMEVIKTQDPHPAEILAEFQGYFWDRDLYWMHWESSKGIIIARMLVTELEKTIEVLERFYEIEDILNVLKETGENIPDETYGFVSKRYNIDFPRPIHTKPPGYGIRQKDSRWLV